MTSSCGHKRGRPEEKNLMKPIRSCILTLLLVAFHFLTAPPCFGLLKEAHSLMGTIVEITIVSPDESKAQQAMGRAFEEIRRIEAALSFYRSESEVSRINEAAAGQEVKVSGEVFGLLQHAQTISELTGGRFDVTFSSLWQLWGRCAKEGRVPSSEELEKAMVLVDFRKLKLREDTSEVELVMPGMKVNLGADRQGLCPGQGREGLEGAGAGQFPGQPRGRYLSCWRGQRRKGVANRDPASSPARRVRRDVVAEGSRGPDLRRL